MKKIKPVYIIAALAVIVLVATVLIVTGGNSEYGLYVSAASGDAAISSDGGEARPLTADVFVKKGDVITIGDTGSCTLIYRTKDNLDENYAIISSGSRVTVSDTFGKGDGTLYLTKGSVLLNNAKEVKNNIILRTDPVSATAKGAVIRMLCEEDQPAVRVDSFCGASQLQLFNSVGQAVDKDGNAAEQPEILGDGRGARILGGISGASPSYDYLNLPTDLSGIDAITLKNLITISAFHDLSFSSEDIKAAYDNTAPKQEEEEAPEESVTDTETSAEVTTVSETTPSETTEETTVSETKTESETERETERETEPRPQETYPVPPRQTAARTTTAEQVGGISDLNSDQMVDTDIGDIDPSELEDVGDIPDIGFDDGGSLEDDGDFSDEGGFIDDSGSLDEAGDTLEDDFDEFGSDEVDIIEMSPIQPEVQGKNYQVTFIIDGKYYYTTVPEGGQAIPPVSPTENSDGLPFLGWDQSLTNINSDLTVNAMF
ncbi:MAG: hypothetical protein J6F31_08465 [Oscillospiraceae bacterium]|nr:hypothetical protein [Oscillospiraceae bacterium]